MADAMTLDSIQKQLCAEIEMLLSLEGGSVTPETDLPALGISSLDFVSLMLAIEHKFGVDLMQKGIKIEDTQSPHALALAVLAGRAA